MKKPFLLPAFLLSHGFVRGHYRRWERYPSRQWSRAAAGSPEAAHEGKPPETAADSKLITPPFEKHHAWAA